jgi:hypothetical protein
MSNKKKNLADIKTLKALFETGLQICYRLEKQLGSAASGPGTRKGLNDDQKAQILLARQKHRMRNKIK